MLGRLIPELRGSGALRRSGLLGSRLSYGARCLATQAQSSDLTAMKLDSNGSEHLYAVFRMHNLPYMVTKGDKVVLPFKMKNINVGDSLVLNDVVTLGSPQLTFNDNKGISSELFDLKASVVEVTREPYYEVYKKKQRCRRLKTVPVEPFQTILMINELKLK